MLTDSNWHTYMKTAPNHKPMDINRIIFLRVARCVRDADKQFGTQVWNVVWGDASKKVDFTSDLAAILDRRLLEYTHVHLDLDTLDESLGRVNNFPSPGGFLPEDLTCLMTMIPTKVHPTSLVVCSFDPRLEGGDTVARHAVKGMCTFVRAMKDRQSLVPSG